MPSRHDESQSFPVNGEPRRAKHRQSLPVEMMCGFGPFQPVFMQCCARMGCFIGVYSMCGLMTSILSIYVVSQITTIEKQFGFSSSQSGFLMSCNDIGFLLTTVFFSYLARKVHIPRTLWLCTVLYGAAGLVCSLAYFVSKDHIAEQASLLFAGRESPISSNISSNVSFRPTSNTPMCIVSANATTNASKCDIEKTQKTFGIGVPNEYSHIALVLIAIGMMIQGLGKAPRYPFLTTYVDDNVKKKNTAMYMGIVSGVGIFGPAIAFSVGGLFSRQYVTLEDVPVTPRHPAWIGAWWLGFVIFGFMAIIVATPLIFFPKRMRPKIPTPRHRGGPKVSECMRAVKDFLKAMWRLVSNPVYVLLVLSTCITLFSVAGMVAFSAKYLETQFFIPAWKANILLGAMNVVAASAGTIVGGFVVTKRQLTPLACIKLTLVVNILGTLTTGLGFVFGCGNAQIAGYNIQSVDAITNSSCSVTCGCDNTTYFPVCGSDNMNYMSPCHAGCQFQEGMSFENCTCIGDKSHSATPAVCESACAMLYPYLAANLIGSFLGTFGMMPLFIALLRSSYRQLFRGCACADHLHGNMSSNDGSTGRHGNGTSLTARAGLCETECGMLYPHLITNICGAFLATLSMMPTFIIKIRSVSEADKPLAVGFSALLSTLCGWLAGPVVFGMVIDTTCLIWNVSCSGTGACALYDNDDLRIKKHAFEIVPRAFVIFLYVLAFFVARKKSDWSVDNPDNSETDGSDVMMNGDRDLALSPLSDWKPDPIYKGTRSPETRTFKSTT